MSVDVSGASDARASNLSIAFHRALICAKALGKVGNDGEDLEISIALKLIELSQYGERDPVRMADAVLQRLKAA
jgi:hypothetical protein